MNSGLNTVCFPQTLVLNNGDGILLRVDGNLKRWGLAERSRSLGTHPKREDLSYLCLFLTLPLRFLVMRSADMPDHTLGVMFCLTMAQKQQNRLPWTGTSEAMSLTNIHLSSIMFPYAVVHVSLELRTFLTPPPETGYAKTTSNHFSS